MTPAAPSPALRVLFVWPNEAARRLESRLATLGVHGRLRLDNIPSIELPAAALPNHYDVLVAPAGILAQLLAHVRRRCAEAVRLLVVTPDGTAAPRDDDLPAPAVVALVALPFEVALEYVARLLAGLTAGDPLTAAARLAWRQAAADWPEPPVRILASAGDVGPAPTPLPSAATRPLGGGSGGSGNVNIFGSVTAGAIVVGDNTIVNTPPTPSGPGKPPPRDPVEQAQLSDLLRFMQAYCSQEEIETLYFDLGLDAEDYGRERPELARKLVNTMSQRGRIDELIARLADAVPERAGELRLLG